jgi:hypothetical protein
LSCRGLVVDEHNGTCRIGDRRIEEGTTLSLDGHTGLVYPGKVAVVVERPIECLKMVESWKARHHRTSPPVRELAASAGEHA